MVMNKQKMINGLADIRVTLLHYFNKNESMWLDILDGDSRQYIEEYNGYEIEGYSGVTIKYLREYLFNKKYSKSMIGYVLLDLLSKGDIQTLYCCDIKQVIFESTKSVHCTNYFITSYDMDNDESFNIASIKHTWHLRYKPFIKSYYAISNYLN